MTSESATSRGTDPASEEEGVGLDPALVERVLEAMGIGRAPSADLDGLRALYGAWCRNVPFDNLRKRVHVAAGDSGPLPGDRPAEFFEAWLENRSGGTCWAGHGAWYALLRALGFAAERATATMLVAPDLPPNHGSVAVSVEGLRHLVDASILHQEPLPLIDGAAIDHPAWGVTARFADGRWHVRWQPPWAPQPFDCRLESFGTTAGEFRERHEQTRAWSPFNYALNFRLNRPAGVVGLAFGQRFRYSLDGSLDVSPIDDAERRRFLREEVGVAPRLIERLPADEPTPPPPGSATAAAREISAPRG